MTIVNVVSRWRGGGGNRARRYGVVVPLAPTDPARLVGSAWTRGDTVWRYRHWHVVAKHGDEVELAAVLDPAARRRVAWRTLRDRTVWQPGWRALPADQI